MSARRRKTLTERLVDSVFEGDSSAFTDKPKARRHCSCRSGSPDACPICTDMETGEKYADQE